MLTRWYSGLAHPFYLWKVSLSVPHVPQKVENPTFLYKHGLEVVELEVIFVTVKCFSFLDTKTVLRMNLVIFSTQTEFPRLGNASVVNSNRGLNASRRHRRDVGDVVARIAERVHHWVAQPLPERLELQLLVRRTVNEIKVLTNDLKDRWSLHPSIYQNKLFLWRYLKSKSAVSTARFLLNASHTKMPEPTATMAKRQLQMGTTTRDRGVWWCTW